MDGIADADLVRRSIAGDGEAFESLVARYWKRLHVLAAHSRLAGMSPEDVVQETFVRAWRNLANIRDPGRVGSWLYTTALRVCQEGRPRRHEGIADGVPARTPDPATAPLAAEADGHVREAVASLDERYRTVVALRYFDSMKCEDIARHLGEPVGTVWTRLHRANAILREKLRPLATECDGRT